MESRTATCTGDTVERLEEWAALERCSETTFGVCSSSCMKYFTGMYFDLKIGLASMYTHTDIKIQISNRLISDLAKKSWDLFGVHAFVDCQTNFFSCTDVLSLTKN